MATKSSPTQNFVPVKEIRDGVVLLKDGSLRALVMVSSINFSLKSVDEQEATIAEFQNFLNSLDFSTQIFIQSRKLDIRPYIAMMEARKKEQINDLIKIQTREYIEFIKNFTDNVNIMSKNFFVVVSYMPAMTQGKKIPIPGIGKKKEGDVEKKSDSFEENRLQLEQRIDVVDQGLTRIGLRTARLGTEETIELLYKIFNPGESEKPLQIV